MNSEFDEMIEDLADPTLDVFLIRFRRGAYRNGAFHGAPLRKRRLAAIVAPLTDDELETSGGLTRVATSKRVLTSEPLYLSDAATGQRADELLIDGVTYRVDQVDRHTFGSLGHFSSIAVKVTT